ncbi:hypothetical protein ACHAXT_001820 [Thalassiosira profunda]
MSDEAGGIGPAAPPTKMEEDRPDLPPPSFLQRKAEPLKELAPRGSCLASSTPSAARGGDNKTARRVRFNPTMDVARLPPEDSAASAYAKAYTEMDVALFKRARTLDVGRIRRKIARTPLDAISRAHLYDCLGLEVLISPDLFRKMRQGKQSHADAVLDEQAEQDRRGVVDEEGLRAASIKSSAWARGRAQMLAANYLLIGKD